MLRRRGDCHNPRSAVARFVESPSDFLEVPRYPPVGIRQRLQRRNSQGLRPECVLRQPKVTCVPYLWQPPELTTRGYRGRIWVCIIPINVPNPAPATTNRAGLAPSSVFEATIPAASPPSVKPTIHPTAVDRSRLSRETSQAWVFKIDCVSAPTAMVSASAVTSSNRPTVSPPCVSRTRTTVPMCRRKLFQASLVACPASESANTTHVIVCMAMSNLGRFAPALVRTCAAWRSARNQHERGRARRLGSLPLATGCENGGAAGSRGPSPRGIERKWSRRLQGLRPERSNSGVVAETEASADFGAPGGTRTPGLLVRSQSLYPTELRARGESDHSIAREPAQRYGRIGFCLGAISARA